MRSASLALAIQGNVKDTYTVLTPNPTSFNGPLEDSIGVTEAGKGIEVSGSTVGPYVSRTV